MRPPILGSPTFPAPTTRQRLPSSFKNIGNKLLIVFLSLRLFFLRSLAFHAAGHASLGQIARDRIDRLSRQVVPQFGIAVASKKCRRFSPAPASARYLRRSRSMASGTSVARQRYPTG